MREQIRREIPFFVAIPAVLWHCIFAIVPLFLIVIMSFKVSDYAGITSWGLDNYKIIFNGDHAIILLRSLILATLTACICLFIGYPVAYFLALHTLRWRSILLFFLTLPLWTNFLTLAYSWFFVLERNGLLNKILLVCGIIQEPIIFVYNKLAVGCVMVYCFLPFMIIPLYAILQKLDKRLLEASQDLGATRWQTFLRVTVPLSITGIKTGLLLVFIPAFGEFVIPIIMGGSRYLYVGSMVTHYLIHAHSERVGAAFTVVSGLVLGISILVGGIYLKALYRTLRRG